MPRVGLVALMTLLLVETGCDGGRHKFVFHGIARKDAVQQCVIDHGVKTVEDPGTRFQDAGSFAFKLFSVGIVVEFNTSQRRAKYTADQDRKRFLHGEKPSGSLGVVRRGNVVLWPIIPPMPKKVVALIEDCIEQTTDG